MLYEDELRLIISNREPFESDISKAKTHFVKMYGAELWEKFDRKYGIGRLASYWELLEIFPEERRPDSRLRTERVQRVKTLRESNVDLDEAALDVLWAEALYVSAKGIEQAAIYGDSLVF
jgi:hypothetical protein